jgi:hypothetical protein
MFSNGFKQVQAPQTLQTKRNIINSIITLLLSRLPATGAALRGFAIKGERSCFSRITPFFIVKNDRKEVTKK